MKNLSLFSLTVKFNLETVKEKKDREYYHSAKKRKKYSWALRVH